MSISMQTASAADFLATAQLIILPDTITDEERLIFEESVENLEEAVTVMIELIRVYRGRHERFLVGKRSVGGGACS